jgi:cytochrome c biogenesis factor
MLVSCLAYSSETSVDFHRRHGSNYHCENRESYTVTIVVKSIVTTQGLVDCISNAAGVPIFLCASIVSRLALGLTQLRVHRVKRARREAEDHSPQLVLKLVFKVLVVIPVYSPTYRWPKTQLT